MLTQRNFKTTDWSNRILVCLFTVISSFCIVGYYSPIFRVNKLNDGDYLRRLSIEWGTTFAGVTSKHVEKSCKFGGYNICCAALEDPDDGELLEQRITNITLHTHHHKKKGHSNPCSLKKRYFPSPYETLHLNASFEYGKIETEGGRRDAYIKYLFSESELKASRTWLERVRVHMTSKGGLCEHTNISVCVVVS